MPLRFCSRVCRFPEDLRLLPLIASDGRSDNGMSCYTMHHHDAFILFLWWRELAGRGGRKEFESLGQIIDARSDRASINLGRVKLLPSQNHLRESSAYIIGTEARGQPIGVRPYGTFLLASLSLAVLDLIPFLVDFGREADSFLAAAFSVPYPCKSSRCRIKRMS